MAQEPGLLYKLDTKSLGANEELITKSLAQTWFITFARVDHFKDSVFPFVFAKPTDAIVSAFHLTREVLVVFSKYDHFDPRALDFVDKIMFQFQNRLDKLCVIIISKDRGIRKKIMQIAMQEKELRLVVPYTYDELLTSASVAPSAIMTRLKEFFYERDLFAFDSPLRTDTYFFGRTPTIQHLYGKYKAGENASLFGLRRIGKTSALFAVKRHLEMRDEPAVFLDCSETAFHKKRWNEALHFIIETGAQALKATNKKFSSAAHYDEKRASQSFESDLQVLRSQTRNQRILFIFDEIENITFETSPSDHWTKERDFIFFWQSIRATYNKNADLFSIIIAGVNPKALETSTVHGFDNPIYRLITPFYLNFFNVAEVKDMVSSIGAYMGLNCDDEVFTYLADDYGGHPFLIRQLCSKLHQTSPRARPHAITKYFYKEQRAKLETYLHDYIDLIITVLRERYNDEYSLLQYLACGDHKTFLDFVSISPSLIHHLEGYGLITEEKGTYHIRIRAVESYLRRIAAAKAPSSQEDKWNEVGQRRNRLETDFREVLRRALKVRYGAEKGKEMFLAIIAPPARKTRLAELSLDDIFSSKKPAELYFEDLRKFVLSQWGDLGGLFGNDREQFQTYMNYVNKHRIDAHAKSIDDESMGLLLIALQWLQEKVSANM